MSDREPINPWVVLLVGICAMLTVEVMLVLLGFEGAATLDEPPGATPTPTDYWQSTVVAVLPIAILLIGAGVAHGVRWWRAGTT